MASVSFHPEASADYQAALAWYQARSVRAAARFEVAVDQAVQAIAAFPLAYTLCDDRHRFFVLKRYPYSLVYRVDGDQVVVIAFAHSRRSAAFWQGRA